MDKKAERIQEIDALRGTAIVLMLFQHTPHYLLTDVLSTDYYAIAYLVSRLSAPLFFLLVGYCIFLSGSRRTQTIGKRGFMEHITTRFLYLFVLGYLVNLLRVKHIFNLNVIHSIAFMVLFAGILYLSGSRKIYTITLVALAFYCFLEPRINPEVMQYMTVGEYAPGLYMIYPVIGLGIAQYYRNKLTQRNLVILGLVLLAISNLLIEAGYTGSVEGIRYNTPPALFLIGGWMLLLYMGLRYLDKLKHTRFISPLLASYGRYSIAIYTIHHLFFVTIPQLLEFRNTLNEIEVIFIFLAFLLTAQVAIRKYEKLTGRDVTSL